MRKSQKMILIAVTLAILAAPPAAWLLSPKLRGSVFVTIAELGPPSWHRWCFEGLAPLGAEGVPGLALLLEQLDDRAESRCRSPGLRTEILADLIELDSADLAPAIPALVADIERERSRTAISSAMVLALMGEHAREALPALKRKHRQLSEAGQASNDILRDMLGDLIAELEKGPGSESSQPK